MAAPKLQKDVNRTEISPAVPPRPAVPAISFQMFACPPPLGYTYNQYRIGSGPALPNSPSTFSNWTQVKVAPTEYTTTVVGYEYKTLEQLAQPNGSIQVQAGWIPVTQTVTDSAGTYQRLIGYRIPKVVTSALPPRYYGPIAHMTYIRFIGVPVAANGYPLGSGTFSGFFDVPTVDGVVRVTNTYAKDSRGVLLPTGGDPLPPYCSRSGNAKVVMLAGFPGRGAVAARPAVEVIDPLPGWNAGANSIQAFDTDARTVFAVAISSAGAVGFAPSSRSRLDDPASLSHAFYFDGSSGSNTVAVMESGRIMLAPRPRAADDVFEIRREAGLVSYRINDVTVFQSPTFLPGEIIVGTALYLGGDGIY